MLKRYIVFVPDGYDASGGWGDVLCERQRHDGHHHYPGIGDPLSFDTVEEAVTAATPVVKEMSCFASFHVVDLQTGKIVEQGAK